MRNAKCKWLNGTNALRAARDNQKWQQNAENLLLEISVEFKQTNSKCVRVAAAPMWQHQLQLEQQLPLCAPCCVPQSMQHKSAHNGVHGCVCILQLGSRAAGRQETRT